MGGSKLQQQEIAETAKTDYSKHSHHTCHIQFNQIDVINTKCQANYSCTMPFKRYK